MEKPTTDEGGSEDLEAEPASRTGGADAGTGVAMGAGAGADGGVGEEDTASGTAMSKDEVGTTVGSSGTSVVVDSWVTMIEATTPAARSHDSDLDFT